MWGAFPAFFKTVASVPPSEILTHRILWSGVFLIGFVAFSGRRELLYTVLLDRKTISVLLVTTGLLSLNWFTFLTAVTTGRVLESSLGYYINPLVSILLGFLFLRENLTLRQKVSVALAAAGVLVQTLMVGKVPLISLVLAFSFGSYGLVRKSARVEPVTGLTVEMVLICPLALGYLAWLMSGSSAVFLKETAVLDVFLVLSGIVTATPLILYGGALNRLRLSTIGIMQYIVPTGHFLLAVFAFGEPFTKGHLVSFGLIWAALFLYMSESLGVSKLPEPGAV
jgi:chloramphenicol-sensitive protein RarD